MPVFLKYGDIKGDVTEPAHRSYIELISAQWGQSRSPTITEIVVTKGSDSASARLFSEATSGSAVTAIIDFVGDDGSVSLRLEMTGALISSCQISGSGGDALESYTLNFTKIEFKNFPGTPPP
jgi:type VI secretion system secreted protein Hcp